MYWGVVGHPLDEVTLMMFDSCLVTVNSISLGTLNSNWIGTKIFCLGINLCNICCEIRCNNF
jgi:hypothetical protein